MKRYIKCSTTISNIKSLPISLYISMETIGFKKFVFEETGAGYDEDDPWYHSSIREFDDAYLALSRNSVVVYDVNAGIYGLADKNNLLEELQFDYCIIPADGYTAPELKYLNTLPDTTESALFLLGFTKLNNLNWYIARLGKYVVLVSSEVQPYRNYQLTYYMYENLSDEELETIEEFLQNYPKADEWTIYKILDRRPIACDGLYELYEL